LTRRRLITIDIVAATLIAVLLATSSKGHDSEVEVPKEFPELNKILENGMSDIPELEKMDHSVDSFLRYWCIEGASLAIMRNDSLVYAKGYGWADKEKGVRMSPSTKLRIASVSKLVTAAGIMHLKDQGRLALQSPVFGPYGILNRFDDAYKDQNYCLITVEDLLRHEGGFTTRAGDPMFSTVVMERQMGLSSPPTQDELVRHLLRQRLTYTPGKDRSYSNFGYLLLSMVIEEVTGMPYETYMRDSVLAPAGCYDFHIGGNYYAERLPGESRYYMQPDSEDVPDINDNSRMVPKCYGGNDVSGLSGAGGWIASTSELARFVASIDLRDAVPDILSPESIRQMTTWVDEATYSLGWVDTKPDGEWTRTGSFSGTSALVKVYPDGECWIMVTNTSSWRGSRFSKNVSGFFRRLRHRWSAVLPARDLFLDGTRA